MHCERTFLYGLELYEGIWTCLCLGLLLNFLVKVLENCVDRTWKTLLYIQAFVNNYLLLQISSTGLAVSYVSADSI